MTDKNLKPGIWCFGGTEKRMKFRKKNLLGPFLIMDIINWFVFVLLLLMLFFLCFLQKTLWCEIVWVITSPKLYVPIFCTYK